jgi:3-dehydroshikimate dehydratase
MTDGSRGATLRAGLCSVTLRALDVDDVARVAGESGLTGIEWGGDVHVPPGDALAARRAVAASTAAGVAVVSYGSYLFAAGLPAPAEPAAVLDAAVALGAPSVRVWAPFGSEVAGPEVVAALAEFAAVAATAELTVGLEFHGGTATATVAGVRGLLDAVAAPNLFTYWQPPYWRGPTDAAADCAEVTALGDRLAHVHVYEWAGAEDRRPLADGGSRWPAVLDAAAAAASALPGPRYALLEFVRGDSVRQLRRDAATLRAWL